MTDDEPTDDNEAGPVLTPEELDFSEDEHVLPIDESRFVIRPDEPAPRRIDTVRSADSSPPDEPGNTPERPGEDDPQSLDREAAAAAIERSVARVDARYGFDAIAKFEDEVYRREVFTNDVVTTFENLVTWYAQHSGGDTPIEEVLGILLVEMDVTVRYPLAPLQRYLDAQDLGPDDTIADFVEVVDERGFYFP